jgi:5-methylcytosine-specific restriction endonuclease McrA
VAWRQSKDPLLSASRYRRNREVLKRQKLPCAVCGRAIPYDQPGAFVAGHIVARHTAKRLGWTESQINALSNLRAECKQCSHRTGAREGNQVKRAMRQRAKTGIIYQLDDHERW